MDPLVCYCFCVTEKTVKEAIRSRRLRTVLQVVEATNAGMGCRGCWFDIEEMLQQYWNSPEGQAADKPAANPDDNAAGSDAGAPPRTTD